ncbi:MAG: ABC transporter ATP-binding protein [Candidatus Thorarchaeota archaeon]
MESFLRFVIPYVKKQKKFFFLVSLVVIVEAFVQTMVPLQIEQIIDIGVPSKELQFIINGFFILLVLAFADFLLNFMMRVGTVYFSQNIMEDIRKDIFRKIELQELEFFSKETIGQLMERTIDSVFQMQDILTWGWRIVSLIIWLSIGTFIAMWINSPILAVLFLIIYPIIIFILKRSSNKNATIFYDTRLKFGDMSETLAENLSGIRTVKSFGREFEQIGSFKDKNTAYSEIAFKQVRVRSVLQPGMIFLIYIGILILLFVGGGLTSLNSISPGNFIAFMLLVIQISVPGRFLGDLGIALQMADASSIRLLEVLNSEISIKDEINSVNLTQISSLISFKNVSFIYPNSKMEVLSDLNLDIKVGEKIALLGPTGSGKSTLIQLLLRFYDPTSGSITIDGTDLRLLTKYSLRNKIGVVHQDNFLFTLSIHDNIAFGNPTATREAVINAAKIAQAHDFIINDLPKGYDSIVGERGVTLSGGQRQRIAIARAVLTDPDILILDDAVSAVDPETEANLQATLKEITKTRTTIVISQRPSSLQFVDRIIVIDSGRIVQSGTHQQLMLESGIYREFINTIENQIKFIDWERPSEEEYLTSKDVKTAKEGAD